MTPGQYDLRKEKELAEWEVQLACAFSGLISLELDEIFLISEKEDL